MGRPNPQMPHVRAWCDRFPKPFVCMAMLMLCQSRNLGSFMGRIAQAKRTAPHPIPRDPQQWMGFYRSIPALFEKMKGLGTQHPSLAGMVSWIESAYEMLVMQDISGEHAERVFDRFLEGFFQNMGDGSTESTPHLSDESKDEPEFQDLPPAMQEGLRALVFFVQVVLPCGLHVRTSPARLFVRARRGDREALMTLLAIDNTVIVDPAISHHLMGQQDGSLLLRQAMDAKPKIGTDYQWKARMAAALRDMAEPLGAVVRHEDIIDLFHAFAEDCDGCEHGDPDIGPAECRAFEKRVNVEKKFWKDKGG